MFRQPTKMNEQQDLFQEIIKHKIIKHKNHYITQIRYEETKPFILDIHYAKRMPSITYAYGLFDYKNKLIGCVTYGSPASPSVCDGIAGK